MLNKLKQALMKVPSSQTPQFRTADDELEVRYLGKWKSNGVIEDDDWQLLESESHSQIQDVLRKFNKESDTDFVYDTSEKNWITFYEEKE